MFILHWLAWLQPHVRIPPTQARCHRWTRRPPHRVDTFPTNRQQYSSCKHTLMWGIQRENARRQLISSVSIAQIYECCSFIIFCALPDTTLKGLVFPSRNKPEIFLFARGMCKPLGATFSVSRMKVAISVQFMGHITTAWEPVNNTFKLFLSYKDVQLPAENAHM